MGVLAGSVCPVSGGKRVPGCRSPTTTLPPGDWLDDKRHGYGVCKFADGTKYRGESAREGGWKGRVCCCACSWGADAGWAWPDWWAPVPPTPATGDWEEDCWLQSAADPAHCRVAGAGVTRAVAGQEANVLIEARDDNSCRRLSGGDEFQVALRWGGRTLRHQHNVASLRATHPAGPDTTSCPCMHARSGPASLAATVKDNGDGTYRASYTPTVAGVYELSILIGAEEHVADSPYPLRRAAHSTLHARTQLAWQEASLAGAPLQLAPPLTHPLMQGVARQARRAAVHRDGAGTQRGHRGRAGALCRRRARQVWQPLAWRGGAACGAAPFGGQPGGRQRQRRGGGGAGASARRLLRRCLHAAGARALAPEHCLPRPAPAWDPLLRARARGCQPRPRRGLSRRVRSSSRRSRSSSRRARGGRAVAGAGARSRCRCAGPVATLGAHCCRGLCRRRRRLGVGLWGRGGAGERRGAIHQGVCVLAPQAAMRCGDAQRAPGLRTISLTNMQPRPARPGSPRRACGGESGGHLEGDQAAEGAQGQGGGGQAAAAAGAWRRIGACGGRALAHASRAQSCRVAGS